MITLEELIKTEKSFKENVETSTNKEYVIKRYNDYFNWLQDKFKEAEGDIKDNINAQQLKVIHSFIHWLDIHNIKAKDVSKEWNKKLVGRVGRYCTEFEERQNNGTLQEQTFKVKEHYVFEDLASSTDIATNSYCWSIIQRTIPNIIPTLIQMFEHGRQYNINETDKMVLRPGHNRQIPDDGRKYWHNGAKEYMTYDECTEKGLGHHLLYDETKRCYVGFKETDPTKIQKEFDEDVTKFLETVFVEPSIMD